MDILAGLKEKLRFIERFYERAACCGLRRGDAASTPFGMVEEVKMTEKREPVQVLGSVLSYHWLSVGLQVSLATYQEWR